MIERVKQTRVLSNIVKLLLAACGVSVVIGFAICLKSLVFLGISSLVGLILLCLWRPFWGLSFLLLLIPFHTMSIKLLTKLFILSKTEILLVSAWKEVIIAMLVFILLAKIALKFNFHIGLTGKIIAWFCCLGIIYVFVAKNILVGLYGFRNAYEGFALFFLATGLSYSKEQLWRFLNFMVITAVILSLWGLYQAIFLGPVFLCKIEYAPTRETLPSAFFITGATQQRATSFFSGPNNLAIHLVMMTFITTSLFFSAERRFHKVWYIVALGIIFICLIYTFSRSAWLGLILGGVIMGFHMKRKKSLAILGVVALLLFILIGGSLGLFGYFHRTFTLQDPSARGHWISVVKSFGFIFQYPLGIGLGMAGQRSVKFLPELLSTESSYFLIFFQIGFVGLFLFVVIFLGFWKESRIVYKKIQDKKLKLLQDGIFGFLIATLTVYFFLPLVQEAEMSVYLWFFVGVTIKMKNWFNQKQQY